MEEEDLHDTYDPTSDPEEQKLIISVLDSFRYTSDRTPARQFLACLAQFN